MNQTLDVLVRVRGNISEGIGALRAFMQTLGGLGAAANNAAGLMANLGRAMGTGLTAPARTAASVLQQTFLTAQQSATSFLGTIITLGASIRSLQLIGQTVAGFAQSFVSSNVQMETFLTRYQALLKTAEAAQARVAELQQLNLKSPFELPDLIAADLALQASGRRTVELVRDVSNAAAALGGTRFELVEIAQAMSRLGSGDFGDAFERLRELNVASKAELEGKGLVFDSSGSYKGSVDDAMTAVQELIREKFGNAAELASQTWTGIVSNISDRIGTLRLIMGQPLFESLKAQLQEVLTAINDPKWETAAAFIGIGINEAVSFAIQALSSFVSFVVTNVSAGIAALDQSVGGLLQLFGAIAQAVAPLGAAIRAVFQGDFSAAGQLVTQFVDNIGAVLIGGLLSLGTDLFAGGANIIVAFADGMISGAVNAVMSAINFITGLIASFLQGFSPPKEGPLSTIDTWFPNVLNAYLGSWSKADWGVLDDVTTRISDTFAELVEAGEVSAQEAMRIVVGDGTQTGLNQLVTTAIDQIIQQGAVAAETWGQIQGALQNTNGELLAAIESKLIETQLNRELSRLQAQLTAIDSGKSREALQDAMEAARDAITKARSHAERKAAKERMALLRAEETRRKDATRDLKAQIELLQTQQSANAQYLNGLDSVNRLREKEAGFMERIAQSVEQLNSGGGGGGAAAQLDRNAEAAWRYNFALADNSGKLQMLQDKLAGVEQGSAEYYDILLQINQLEGTMADEAERSAKETERLAKARADAAWDYSFAIGDNETKLGMLQEKLAGVEEGSVEYYEILGQIHNLEGTMQSDRESAARQAENEAKKRTDAEFDYQMKIADTAGKLALLREKLGTVEEGSAEYYNILGQIHDLEGQAAKAATGRGAAGAGAANAAKNAAISAAGPIGESVNQVSAALDKGREKWAAVGAEIDKGREKFERFKSIMDISSTFTSATNPLVKFFVDGIDAVQNFMDALQPFFALLEQFVNPTLNLPFKTPDMSKVEFGPDGIPLNFNPETIDFDRVVAEFKTGLANAFIQANFRDVFGPIKTKIVESIQALDFADGIKVALLGAGLLTVGPLLLTALAGIPALVGGLLGPLGFLAGPLSVLASPLRLIAGLLTGFGGGLVSVASAVLSGTSGLISLGGAMFGFLGPLGLVLGPLALLAGAIIGLDALGIDLLPTLENIATFLGDAFLVGLETATNALEAFGPEIAAEIGHITGEIIRLLADWTTAFGGWVVKAIPIIGRALNSLLTTLLSFISREAPNIVQALLGWAMAFGDMVFAAIPLVLEQLAVLLTTIGDWIVAEGPRLLALLGMWGVELVEWVIDALPNLVTALTTFIDTLLQWIFDNAPRLLQQLGEWGAKFIEWILPRIPPMLEKLGEVLVALLVWLGEKALEIGTKLLEWGAEFVKWIVPRIPDILAALGELLLDILTWIGEKALELGAKLLEWAGQFLNWIGTDVLPSLPSKLGELLTAILVWIGEKAVDLGIALVKWGAEFLVWIGKTVTELPSRLANIMLAISVWIAQVVPELATKVGSWVSAFWTWITTAVSEAPTKLQSIAQAILDWVGKLPDKIKQAFVDIGSAIIDWIIEGLKNIKDRIYNATVGKLEDAAFDLYSFFGGQAENATPVVEGQWRGVGVGVSAGIGAGIEQQKPALEAQTRGLMNSLLAAAQGQLGIKSPSTVMRDLVGVPVVQGVEAGINQQAPSLFGLFGSTLANLNTLLGAVPLPTTMGSVLSNVLGSATPVLSSIQGAVDTSLAATQTTATGHLNALQTNAQTAFSTLLGNVTSATPQIQSAIATGLDQAKIAGDTSFKGLISLIGTTIDTVRGKISGAVTPYETAARAAGNAIANGINAGMAAKVAEIARQAADLVGAALRAAKDAAGIASPARLFIREVGNPIAEGMAEGILEGKGGLASAVKSVIQPLTGIAQRSFGPMQNVFDTAITHANGQAHSLLQGVNRQLAQSPLEVALGGRQAFTQGLGFGPPQINRNVNIDIKTDMPADRLEVVMRAMLEEDREDMVRDLQRSLFGV